MRLVVLLLLTVLACAGPEGPSPGEPASVDARPPGGTPIGRSNYPRSGRFSYRLLQVEPGAQDMLNVDLELQYGSNRYFQHVEVRVIVYGVEGEIRRVDVPVGALGGRFQKPLRRFRARVPDVRFEVADVGLELLIVVQ